MKKFIALTLMAGLLTTGAFAAPLYTYSSEGPITSSISLTQVSNFYSDHNISYTYIKVDLNDESTSLKLLKSANIDKLDKMQNLVRSEDNVVAALNADFFSKAPNGGALSLGMEVKDGHLVQSPINPDTMATVFYNGETAAISYVDFNISVTAPNGATEKVTHLNKHTEYYGNILMYTSEFNGGYSPAPGGEVVEVVVSDGKIAEFRRNMPPTEIPQDGCVFVVSEGVSMFFANNFEVGDEITIDYSVNPSLENVQEAFGGGAVLVKDGQLIENFSHTVSGYNPRSALGVDETGKILYLVAVDGRQDESRGMSMSELAWLMQSLGCHNAINLDGGGSTNMYAARIWDESPVTINKPTENRSVINALGITYDAPLGKPFGIRIRGGDRVYIGESVFMDAAVYDENMRHLNADIEWSATKGYVADGKYYATEAGVAVITAKCGELTAKKEVYVSKEISGIEVKGYMQIQTGTSANLNVSIFDAKGNVKKATNNDGLKVTSSNTDAVEADGLKLTAVGKGKSIITIEKDGAVSYVSVVADEKEVLKETLGKNFTYLPLPDNKYTDLPTGKKTGDTFRIGASFVGEETLMGHFVNAKMKEALEEATSNHLIKYDCYFDAKEDENALYMHVDVGRGGIRATEPQQWDYIMEAVSKSDKKDIFVISDESVFGNSNFENRVFKDYFAGLEGRNVWVINRGYRNTYRYEDGIHYFTVANHQKEEMGVDQLENYKYLEFTFGNTTSFEWKNLFEV